VCSLTQPQTNQPDLGQVRLLKPAINHTHSTEKYVYLVIQLRYQLLYVARQLDSQDHAHARIHLARVPVICLWPSRSGSDQSVSDEELLTATDTVTDARFIQSHPIKISFGKCQPFSKLFQRTIPRWFCVTNRLACQVMISELSVISDIFPDMGFNNVTATSPGGFA